MSEALQKRFCLQCGKQLVLGSENGESRQLCPDKSCGWIFYNNPVPVVAAIVEKTLPDGSTCVVLVRSRGWPKDWFGLVTGFLEKGESVRDGVLREVKEEVGLDGRIVDFLGVYDFKRYNQIIIAYHIKVDDPNSKIVLQESELEAYRTVPLHRLRPFPGPTGQAVAEFLKRRAMSMSSKL